MKKYSLRFALLSILLILLLGLMPVSPAYAALGISSVSPSQVVNNVDTVITVNGSDFVVGSTVILLNGSALTTNVQNPSKLTAVIPAGTPVGCHTLTVSTGVEPDVDWSCLNVIAPTPTNTPTATTEPLPFVRPQLVLSSSNTNGEVATNSEFKLNLKLKNAGSATAYSVQAVFTSADLAPLRNGGVAVLGTLAPGNEAEVSQRFIVTGQLSGQLIVAVDVTVTYYDDQGTSFSDKFTLSLGTTNGGNSGVVYPTATPTGIKSSQLVIPSYAVSLDPLQPGEQFTLTMTVQNMGNAKANRITMIVGGGSSGGSSSGTPSPGGVSGGSGEFTNFAPVGASNVQSLGDLPSGGMIQAAQNLIVNVSTEPGAYPMRVTFSYLNDKNEIVNDEQVITLLVYSLPNVEVNFYRPPDPFFVGQPGMLPLQVVNITRHSSVLGNMKVTAESGMVENGTSLIGSLDAGGYFTLDSIFTPEQPGTQILNVTIEYTDDFNQPRTLTRKLEVEVTDDMIEEPILDPSMGGESPLAEPETLGQKAWRFVLGLLGLDSAPPAGGEQIAPEFEESVPEVKPGMGKG